MAAATTDELAAVSTVDLASMSFEPGPGHDARLANVLLAVEEKRNPFMEAASVLLRTLAELPDSPPSEANVHGLNLLLRQEMQTFTRLCEQANLRRDHMLAVRYVLCTALDEMISLKASAGGEGGHTGVWSTQALLNAFHGESGGGETVFLLIGRMAQAPDEHGQVLEVIHHVLSLGFMGSYRMRPDGDRMLQAIRHRLHAMASAGREPVPRELSMRWQGVGPGRFKLLRSVPVWVSASVLGLALFAQFSWYKYHLLGEAAQVRRHIEAVAGMQPPAPRAGQRLNLAQLLRTEIAQGVVKVEESEQRALLTFRGDGMFAGGLDRLSPRTLAILEKVAPALQQVSGMVQVIGHTDNQPIATPEFPDNQVLSDKRAQRVLDVLREKGIDARRLQAIGKGDTAPEAPNTTPTGRASNRRVEIEVLTAGIASGTAALSATRKPQELP